MRQPSYSGQFKRDVKQAQKRGKDMGKLKILLTLRIPRNPTSHSTRIRPRIPRESGQFRAW